MKHNYHIKLGIVICILGVIIISGCTQNQQKNPQNTTNPKNNSYVTVTIQNFTYNPNTLTVKPGTTITWINQDSATHDVTGDSGTFISEDLARGDSYTHNFTKSGEYPYHCNEHPSMTGKIIVQ